MKQILLYAVMVLYFTNNLVAQPTAIQWGQKVIVHDQSVLKQEKGADAAAVHFRRSYGSEYGRMLQLSSGKWLAAYTISQNDGYQKDADGGFELEIAESTDRGNHWKKIALIADKGRDLDNAQMIELPDHSVLLACRSVRWQESYRLPVYKSRDNGNTWNKVSIIDAKEGKPGELGKPDKGVYEPHLHFLEDGRLAVMYASEKHVTDSIAYSQIIAQKVSFDFGQTWGSEIWVAYKPGEHASRPGMPVWTKMKNGAYIAVYEICGPQKCDVYYKTSKDGLNWPVGFGNLIPEQTGGPYIVSLDDGTLVVTSNKGNISVSNDYGVSWHIADRPWRHQEDFSKDWAQTIWSSLYPFQDGLIAMTAVKRKQGGHNIQIRFGQLKLKQ